MRYDDELIDMEGMRCRISQSGIRSNLPSPECTDNAILSGNLATITFVVVVSSLVQSGCRTSGIPSAISCAFRLACVECET
jgi:hypothetical protein